MNEGKILISINITPSLKSEMEKIVLRGDEPSQNELIVKAVNEYLTRNYRKNGKGGR